jgi:O-antigen ligase
MQFPTRAFARKPDDTYMAALALLVGLLWAACLMLTPLVGSMAYAIPAGLIVTAAGAYVLLLSTAGQARGAIVLAAFVVIVLNLNFRQRELGETGLDWQNGIKLASWLALAAVAALRWRSILSMARDPALCCAGLFAAFAVISATWSVDPAYTGASALGLLAYLGLACMLVSDLPDEQAIGVIMWSLAIYIAINLVAAIVAPDSAWLAPSVEETVYRLQGMAGHPNVLGQQAGVFITITAIARRHKRISRGLFFALLALGVTALIMTNSRTTMVAVAVSWGLIATRRKGFLAHAATAGLVSAGVVLLIAAAGFLSDIQTLLSGLSRTGRGNEILTLTGRTELWSAAWQLFLERPLLGWGYNGTEGLLAQMMGPSFIGTAVNAHNMFLQSLMSIGLAGSAFGFGFIAVLCTRFFTRPDSTRDQIMALTLMIGVGEVEIFATPVLLTLMVFWVVARDARRQSRRALPDHAWAVRSI